MGWLSKLFNLELDGKESSRPYSAAFGSNSRSNSGGKQPNGGKQGEGSKSDAYNRLKLVLMHDRTQISPDVLSKMRDELVQVISKYVDIDREALELNLETESNTIALVANIPVMRMKPPASADTTELKTTASPVPLESCTATVSLSESTTPVVPTTQGATLPTVPATTTPTAPQTRTTPPPPASTQPGLTQTTLKNPVAVASAATNPAVSKSNPFGDTPATVGASSLHPKSASTPAAVTTGPKTPVATP